MREEAKQNAWTEHYERLISTLSLSVKWDSEHLSNKPLLEAGLKLGGWGDLVEMVSLIWTTSPCLQLRENF